ncbi:hypothetical protein CY34DRAFT_17720 [Suillus luteus UH-Slu-Lm8-n1]|uniref:Unplaced genomic scaffold CY34scaffold_622, whole genome shotgun sequence n=1 Tax=Suillus luteus UH-Slu-Lm8-n1 TaxID=930992 RepID=A0A0C9ZAB7_9AGAM|nr:hypothetical protein CY34DRAFT_17720 [Suillus luteus UH-Slu-Lm8-n1]
MTGQVTDKYNLPPPPGLPIFPDTGTDEDGKHEDACYQADAVLVSRIWPVNQARVPSIFATFFRVRDMMIGETLSIQLLATLPIQTCLFPRLLSLTWLDQHQLTNTGDFCFFLSSTLRRCHVLELRIDFYHIGTRCPALEDFIIPDDSDTALLSEVIHLSATPTLFEVKILASRDIHCPLDNLNCVTFLNLTTPSFRGIEVAAVLPIIKRFELPSLKKFEMYAHVLPWAEAEHLFRALSRCKASQTLEHINISSGNRTQRHSGDSLTAVRQFLCLKQLHTLRLSVHLPIYLNNDLLFEAMTSWPHIRFLSLVSPHFYTPTITFRGLFTALHQCPRLHTLDISLDTVNIDIDHTDESFQHASLQELILATSRISDAEAVARIVFSVFPSVDQVSPGFKRPTRGCIEVQRRRERFSRTLWDSGRRTRGCIDAQIHLDSLRASADLDRSILI